MASGSYGWCSHAIHCFRLQSAERLLLMRIVSERAKFAVKRSRSASVSRNCAARRVAAAGLFSSWARPAASVPRAAIFSFCISIDSVLRNLEVTVRKILKGAEGLQESNVWKAA